MSRRKSLDRLVSIKQSLRAVQEAALRRANAAVSAAESEVERATAIRSQLSTRLAARELLSAAELASHAELATIARRGVRKAKDRLHLQSEEAAVTRSGTRIKVSCVRA